MSEYPKICFDRILPRDLYRPQRMMAIGGRLRAVFEFRKMWMNGSNLHVRFMDGTAAQHAIVKEEASWWTEHANLTFEFNEASDAEIRITFDPTSGAWSFVGTDCQNIPQNEASMNLGFLDDGTAAHEFGHAIGLGHEHQNPEGGLRWNREEVIKDLSGPPNYWTVEQIEHNVMNKYKNNQIRGTEFDDDSIMLYAFPARWTLDGVATKSNDVLSRLDKEFIASEEAYTGRGKTGADAAEIIVSDMSPTEASIGNPREEDLFKFTVAVEGRHIVETSGETDIVMKLFGPNSQTSLIAEDDDGGVGLNSKIVADLIPGEYFVQIRHYNSNEGTGTYNIRVSK
ncbi:MAG: peptidase [Thermoplasmata archaeon]|nr:peptidase [Thermoplasmata archaeon]